MKDLLVINDGAKSSNGGSSNYFNPLTKDIIIGAIYNYHPQDVACWINTIHACKIYADVIIINYGCPQETLDFLARKGVRVFNGELNGLHIVVQRFFDMYRILRELPLCDYRSVLATDVKDVIFQKDPFGRFSHKGYKNAGILASTENIRYRDEDWGDNNLKVCFPHLYETFKNNIIYNAGTICGEMELMIDLFLHIFHLSLVGCNNDPQPDQAAYNILINTRPFIYNTYFTEDSDAWVANLGTSLADVIQPGSTVAPKDKYAQFQFDSPPVIKDGIVFNNNGEIYSIVHQYDRVQNLKEITRNRFGSIN